MAQHPERTEPVRWAASMISPSAELDCAPLFRREFELDSGHGEVTSATLHLSALGIFEASLDGLPVSDELLAPGWTSYEWRLGYRSYDVTEQLAAPPAPAAHADTTTSHVLGALLGNGWYRGRLGWEGKRNIYGDRSGLIAQIEITFEDGHRQLVVTDEQWQAGPSDVVDDDLYDGQTIDARRRDDAWTRPGAVLHGWVGVDLLEFNRDLLTPRLSPPVRRHERIRPIAIWTSDSGATLADFGQNLVGVVRLRATGPAGTEITVRHAEVLDDGELGTRPLRTAKATDRFILSGSPEGDEFEPAFTFHGFGYAEVSGFPGALTRDDIEAVVIHSDVRRIGHFTCSDELLNRLHENVVWSFRGNAVDLPTDCPQRDERLGWTGDIAVFAPTAAWLFDVDSFLGDWLLDLDAETVYADGLVPFVVPNLLRHADRSVFPHFDSTAVWGDAAVWVPWALWQAYGDKEGLETRYSSMTAHVRRVAGLLSPHNLWDKGLQLGDWLDPDAPPDQPWAAKADRRVVATACCYRSARIAAEAARILQNEEDSDEFDRLADRVRAAFTERYVHDDGTIESDAATAYALAVCFGVVSGIERERAGTRLAELAAANGYRISTGFAGTPFILDALSSTGHLDAAYRLLTEQSCPSWLYPVTMGATTIWERWDSMLPDGSINPGEMTSFNHYALGAVADWMHRTIGGIAPLEPGYARVLIAPRPGGRITWAEASLETPHGAVVVAWRLESDRLQVDVSLPDGVSGVLDLPGAEPSEIGSGRHRVEVPA